MWASGSAKTSEKVRSGPQREDGIKHLKQGRGKSLGRRRGSSPTEAHWPGPGRHFASRVAITSWLPCCTPTVFQEFPHRSLHRVLLWEILKKNCQVPELHPATVCLPTPLARLELPSSLRCHSSPAHQPSAPRGQPP